MVAGHRPFSLSAGGRLTAIAQWFQGGDSWQLAASMDDRLWSLLEQTGFSFLADLKRHFATPWHVACAVDDLDDTALLIRQLRAGLLESEEQREAKRVWDWLQDNSSLLKRVQSRLMGKAQRVEAFIRETPSASSVYDQQVSGSIELQKQVSKSHHRWLANGGGTPADAEKAAKKFWGTVLVQIMIEAGLPICNLKADTEEQRAAYALRALGPRRSKTLRNRARTWKKAREWMLRVKNRPFPKDPTDVVDYLTFLEQDVGTKSCIAEFMASLSVLEDAGQVPTNQQLCKDRLVVAASQSFGAEVLEGKTAKAQAPPLSIAMLLSLEMYVVSSSNPKYSRFLAWACLIAVWACMRVSDLQGVDVSRLQLFCSGLKGFLVRTKTTGNDKKVLEVPFFIRRDANLSGHDWLSKGYDLLQSFGQLGRCFLVWQSSDDMQEPHYKFARPEVISGYFRLIWQKLQVPFKKVGENKWKLAGGSCLVGHACFLFWTGHSMRHVLPTISAVFGESQERRNYLGRWRVNSQQSSDYVHTCRQIVHDVQGLVCDKLSGGAPGYDEEELLMQLGDWLKTRGEDPGPILKPLRIMRKVQGCWVLNQKWPLLGDTGTGLLPEPPEVVLRDQDRDGGSSPFWVSISRHSGHRRLHIRGQCWVEPSSCHCFEELWEVGPNTADSFCKLCYRDRQVDASSSSGDSSSTDVGEAE